MAIKDGVAIPEVIKVLAVSIGLLCLQVIANALGIGGLPIVLTMYAIVIGVSNMFAIDDSGFHLVNEKLKPYDYLTRAGVDFMMVLVGMLMWFTAGIWHGLDKTVKAFDKPADAFKEMNGSSFLVKLLYLEISHLTLFGFCQLWVNLFNAMNAWRNS